eukprot:TRINITY_DN38381_c0_g1_i1.p1 TRINITY_DN38381_c0_g1~~TRINITY_DN38381_c0_g1_i1.p1  ORF type:complete len:708 (+),score=183.57 TRINITY_DN38381_c0_g1_i1:208-2331(+)
MKFGRQLEEYMLPEWQEHYIAYRALKKILEQPATSSKLSPKPMAGFGSAWSSRASRQQRSASAPHVSTEAKAEASEAPSLEHGLADPWFRLLEDEARHAGEFLHLMLQDLETQLGDLKRALDEVTDLDAEPSSTRRLYLDAIRRQLEATERLRGFAELNHAALYKILKKRDKIREDSSGLTHELPRLLELTRLAEVKRFDALASELQRLSLRLQPKGLSLSAPEKVVWIAEGFGSAAGFQVGTNDVLLGFLLGSCASLFVASIALLALPEATPHRFHVAYFLMPMPVFRVVFSVLLVLLCTGTIARVCADWSIDVKFVLGIDPRNKVRPGFFFSRAAALGAIWVFVFGAYVVDYKWGIISFDAARREQAPWLSHGAAQHFVVYPVLVMIGALVVLFWPSTIFRNRYKKEVLWSFGRVACAPAYKVDFFDNLVGDILTSLAKPLQDIPAAYCYLVAPHPMPESLVDHFNAHGTACLDLGLYKASCFTIAMLPFLFRALQCLRRFRDHGERIHLFNFGKYVSSIVVAVVSFWKPSTNMVILICSFATLYAFAWDVCIDWGFQWTPVARLVGDTSASIGKTTSDASKEADDARVLSIERGLARPSRIFPTRIYWICSVLDFLARITWVTTLMPSKIITSDRVVSVVFVSYVASMEILRRSVWAVLRIEHCQMVSDNNFRALVRLPPKLSLRKARSLENAQVPLLAAQGRR